MAELSWWEAVLLGVVQGVTEWLPVSSSGHLVIVQEARGVEVPVFYDLWLHVATLLVVVVHYRARLLAMARGVLSWPAAARAVGAGGWRAAMDADRRMALLLVVGTVPIVVAGLLLRDAVEAAFGSVRAVGASLLVTTALLLSTLLARRRRPTTPARALLVGCFQALALLPGVSRSGATIAGAVHVGMDRREAGDFAFLLFVPALTGALTLLLPDALRDGGGGLGWGAYLAGGAAAGLVGYASLRLLLATVQRWGIWPYAPYTLALGLWLLL